MRCYDCGAEITKSVRQFREPKDRRHKAGFRDVCEGCYEKGPRVGRVIATMPPIPAPDRKEKE